jgi:hypothetical protein
VNVGGHAVLIEELVELLFVDPVRALDLAIEVLGPWPDVDVPDIQSLQGASGTLIETLHRCRFESRGCGMAADGTSSTNWMAFRWLHAS